jgi:hypothetical protein
MFWVTKHDHAAFFTMHDLVLVETPAGSKASLVWLYSVSF